jgi:AcrR family transcriptional regulator
MSFAGIAPVSGVKTAEFRRNAAFDRKIEGRDFLMHWRKVSMFPEWRGFGWARVVSFADYRDRRKINGAHIAQDLQRSPVDVSIAHMKVTKEPYHHGDLESALVAFALERVRSGGTENFSLREAAREVGVSSGAAYNHFTDKNQLLAAVGAEAHKMLARRTLKATAGLSGIKRVEAVGRAYIEFASAEPRLFRLAFSRIGVASRPAPFPTREHNAVPGSYEQLRMALMEIQPDSTKPIDEDVLALAWSVAHGGALQHIPPASR